MRIYNLKSWFNRVAIARIHMREEFEKQNNDRKNLHSEESVASIRLVESIAQASSASLLPMRVSCATQYRLASGPVNLNLLQEDEYVFCNVFTNINLTF